MLRHTLSNLFTDLFGKKKHGKKQKCLFLLMLPEEVKLYTFEFLTVAELCEAACVCREFRALAMDDSLWRHIFVKLASKDAPCARVCHSSLVYGDKMYVYGGHVPDAQNYIRDVKNEFHSYQFSTKKWELVTPKTGLGSEALPFKTEHTAVSHKNKMYLFGGYSGSLGYRDTSIYEYNFDTKQCARVEVEGAMPPDRSAHTAVVYKNDMYIMGGWDGNESNNDFYAFNFSTRRWSEVQHTGVTPPRVRSHSAVLYRDYMVVFGGFGENIHPTSIFMYHFPTHVWSEVPTPVRSRSEREIMHPKECDDDDEKHLAGPSGRSRFKMIYHEESQSIWMFGGWNRKTYFADLWRFKLDTMTWHKMDASFDLKGVGQHSIVVHQGKMYLYGGYCSDWKAPHPYLYVYKLPVCSSVEA